LLVAGCNEKKWQNQKGLVVMVDNLEEPLKYIQIRIAWEQPMVSSEDFPNKTKPLTEA